MSDYIIEVNDLIKDFPNVRAVDNVSFNVGQSEIFGFLGPNGAGKTTTINILCTFLKPTNGKVVVNGYDVMENPYEVRRSIGIVFQDPSLDERLTAYENLNFHGIIYRMQKKIRRERVAEVLDLVGLYEKKNYVVKTFSGGMKRRLEIARGLMHRPKILFLDEPTIGLDPQTREYIWDYVLKISKEEGITVFLTTHYMEEAEICGRIGIIDYGRIVALDTPDKLKKAFGVDTLHEVFLKVTGHDIRDEESTPRERLKDGVMRRFRLR